VADPTPTSQADLSQWLANIESLTYYQVLNLEPTASTDDIRAAFHDFSRRFHPDTLREQAPEVREQARTVFARGAEAYAVLRTPKRRSEYDLALAQGRNRLNERASADTSGAPSGARRSLEEVCQTGAGRLHARQAARALSDGQLREAASLLRKAVFAEQKNTELAERLRSIEELIKMGG
jgi:curved DNA-binding protein CbpA